MSFMSFIFLLIFVFVVLPIIAVIAIVDMYITKNKAKKNVVPAQTNVENDNMVDITQLGEVDLMHQLHPAEPSPGKQIMLLHHNKKGGPEGPPYR